MTLKSFTSKFICGLAASLLLSATAVATPVFLGSIQHDYGSVAGRVAPTSFGTSSVLCDTLNATSVTVQGNSGASNCQRFADGFDFSGIAYNSIDHFTLDLDFSGARDQSYGFWIFSVNEKWHARPASSYTNGSGQTGPTLNASGSQSFSFDSSLDVFNDILASQSFFLWLSTNSASRFDFALDSANLSLYGEAAPTTSVPEPGTLALLALGLLGLFCACRFKTSDNKA